MNCSGSSFLIDLFRGEQAAIEHLEAHDGPLYAPTVALGEVYEGVFARGDRIDDLGLTWLTPLPFTETAARETARIAVELDRRGERINYEDVQIAGTVRERDGVLVTRDRDFERVEGLHVERY